MPREAARATARKNKAFHQAILEQVKQRQTPNHKVLGVPSKEYDRQAPFEI
jgi:hypothetical protein